MNQEIKVGTIVQVINVTMCEDGEPFHHMEDGTIAEVLFVDEDTNEFKIGFIHHDEHEHNYFEQIVPGQDIEYFPNQKLKIKSK